MSQHSDALMAGKPVFNISQSVAARTAEKSVNRTEARKVRKRFLPFGRLLEVISEWSLEERGKAVEVAG
jgi:hypothetical protein